MNVSLLLLNRTDVLDFLPPVLNKSSFDSDTPMELFKRNDSAAFTESQVKAGAELPDLTYLYVLVTLINVVIFLVGVGGNILVLLVISR